MRIIKIFDTTLRDGEQSPGASLNQKEKIEIALQLEKLGVDAIEAGFPASSPDDFNAVASVAKIIKKAEVAGLCRALSKDIDACAKALKAAKHPRIHTFIATSDIHMLHKLRMSKEEVLESAVQAVKYARRLSPTVEFSAEDATRSNLDFLCRIVEAVIKAGARVVNIPDTVGYTVPDEYASIIRTLKNRVPNIDKAVISVHCHNDLGLAVANSLAAVGAGAEQVECTINGIGERAGNASLEEIVMGLKTRGDFFGVKTGIKTGEIFRTSRMVSHLTGVVVQPNKAIVGDNAFAHEAGIHQDGVIKERTTYEIMKPEDIGLKESLLVLGKHSGRHALSRKLNELGVKISKEELNKLFERFKKLADQKKYIYDEDIESIIDDEIFASPKKTFVLDYIHITSGNTTLPTATVRIKKDDKMFHEAACGDGPVDAAYKAIDRITGIATELVQYSLKGVTVGKDALGEVNIALKIKGREISGKAASTDIIEASAKAYLNAVNRYKMLEKK